MMVVLGDMDNFMLAKMEARDHQLKKKKKQSGLVLRSSTNKRNPYSICKMLVCLDVCQFQPSIQPLLEKMHKQKAKGPTTP